jgi:PTS system cellobiose-specific IIA component
MDETKYQTAFDLILKAGNAKSTALMAIEAAREFNFEEADRLLGKAEEEMRLAHQAQIELIQQEAQGNPVDVNIILVHAQDHMTMSMMAKDNADEFVNLYKMLQKLLIKEDK